MPFTIPQIALLVAAGATAYFVYCVFIKRGK